MKYCGALLTVLLLAAAAMADQDEQPCEMDRECEYDECCVLSFTGTRKVCRDIGDDYGDVCGGIYFCNSCRKGLECVTVANSDKQNVVHDVGNCGHPANGTCMWPNREGLQGGQGRDRPVL